MMIRINLLPVRQVKKREKGQKVLFLMAAALVATLVGNYAWYAGYQSEYTRRQTQIAEIDQKIRDLEKVIGEVNDINKRRKEVQDKLKVLEALRKGRSGPVRLLDALATATPKNVSLKEFDEKGNAVKLTGHARSHDDVAELMRGLSSMVWTPKGMGRLIEQKHDAKNARVELLAQGGAIEDFPTGELGRFFSAIELKKAEQKDVKEAGGVTGKRVDFEINLNANYAI